MSACNWESERPNAYKWTEAAYDALLRGDLTAVVQAVGGVRSALVSGACPRCQDAFLYGEILEAATSDTYKVLGRPAPAPDADRWVPLVVSCACTEAHTGRPDAVRFGCGINFRVDVLDTE